MAFTYDASAGATRDLLRFHIGDTDTVNSDKQIFTDAELDMIITNYGTNIFTIAGHCMLAIASSSARIATACAIGNRDFNVDRSKVAKECREQAKEFFKRAAEDFYATEVALEDENLDYFDGLGHSEYEYDTGIEELNT